MQLTSQHCQDTDLQKSSIVRLTPHQLSLWSSSVLSVKKRPIQHRQKDISESRFTMLLQLGEADQSTRGLFSSSVWTKQTHLNHTLLSF